MKITTYAPMPPQLSALKIVLSDQEVREAVFNYLARHGIECAGPGNARLFMPNIADGNFEVTLDEGAWINTIRPTE